MSREVEVAVATHVGMVREENQDHHGVFDSSDERVRREKGVFVVVADGMGGHTGGTIASHTAVDALLDTYKGSTQRSMRDLLEEAVRTSNNVVRERADADPKISDMGTTCVCLVVRGGVAMVAHLGDSRCYLVRGGVVEQITRDHTYLNELVDIGLLTAEQAKGHPDRNIITRCVGMREDFEIEFNRRDIQVDDRLVLCSDGLTNFVTDEEIGRIVESQKPKAACETLVRTANENGGEDNITVAIVTVHDVPDADPELAALDEEENVVSSKVTPIIRRDELGPDVLGDDAHKAMVAESIGAPARTERSSWRRRLWYWLIGVEVVALAVIQFVIWKS